MKFVDQCKNSYYQGLLCDLYAGKDGCFVCFMQMFYQNNLCKSLEREVDFFEVIAKKELKNCEILSRLLTKVGGDLQYHSSSRVFISGKTIDYVKNLKKMIESDVELMEVSQVNLKNAISKIDDKQIVGDLKKVLQNKRESLSLLKENLTNL